MFNVEKKKINLFAPWHPQGGGHNVRDFNGLYLTNYELLVRISKIQ